MLVVGLGELSGRRGVCTPSAVAVGVAALLALVGGLAFAAALADAHERSFGSDVTAAFALPAETATTVSGTVTSRRAACVRDRRVAVLAQYGIGRGAPADWIFTRTDDSGNYSVTLPAGHPYHWFEARAPKLKLLKNRRHSHTCKRAYSDPSSALAGNAS